MKVCKSGLHEFEGKRCRECIRAYGRAKYAANPEKAAAKAKAYKLANKESLANYNKAYRKKTIESRLAYEKQYREANLDKRHTTNKVWREAHVTSRSARLKMWRNTHKKQQAASNRTYQIANSDKINAIVAKRRSTKLKAIPIWLTLEHLVQIQEIYTEAKLLKAEDGIPREVDHIVPLQGKTVCGLHVPWNLRVVLASENRRKGNKLIIEVEKDVDIVK